MNIYIGCGLTHVPRTFFADYVSFLHELAHALEALSSIANVQYALINSDPQLASKPKGDRPALCYDWDRRMVEEADVMIAEASFPSTGLGIELQIAETAGIPVIMMIGDHGLNHMDPAHYINPDQSEHDLQIGAGIVSLMALGLPAIRKIISYTNFSDAISEAAATVTLWS